MGLRLLVMMVGMMLTVSVAQSQSRIKDIVTLQSSRDNQLIGYGLVVGLAGTGDSLRNAPFTETSMRSMLDTLGIATESGSARLNNIAAVIVTANLPAFVRHGSRIDIDVSSLGDASSLSGGRLVMTPLRGADGEIYAVAQGAVSVAGFLAEGDAATLSQGTPTSGRIVNGAIVERELHGQMSEDSELTLQLRNPDFSTAVAITDEINGFASGQYGTRPAREIDSRTVIVKIPKGISSARFIASIESLVIKTDSPARVILDADTGTVVIGQDVRVSPVAVSHGALTVKISEAPTISQPQPFSDGVTAEEPFTNIEVNDEGTALGIVNGASLQTLVEGLNRLGVGPRETIAILQTIKNAGALQADLVVQ